MNEIADVMEAGPKDETEDEDETEDNPEVKNVEMAKSFNDYGFGGPRKGSPIGKYPSMRSVIMSAANSAFFTTVLLP